MLMYHTLVLYLFLCKSGDVDGHMDVIILVL